MKSKILATAAAICLTAWSMASCAQQHTVGETIDDSTITASVKAALVDTDSVHARNINVETYKGTVALIGYVRSKEQHATAMKVAKGVSGVDDVADALLIVPEKRSLGTTIDDETIEGKVKLKMADIGAENIFGTVTEVRNGEVLLGGFVKSSAVRDEITKAVKSIDGVTKVHNRLHVKD